MTQPCEPFIVGPDSEFRLHIRPDPDATRLNWLVKSSRAVDVYLVSQDQLAAYDANDDWEYLEGQAHRRRHDGTHRVNREGPSTLLIINRSAEPVAVEYDVWADD